MTLRKIILLAASAYMLVIGGGLLIYRVAIVYPELVDLTLSSHKSDIRAINSSYLNEQSHLSFFNRDWAKWDETYQYIKQPDNGFVERNINSDSFLSSNIDIVAIFNNQQENLYTGTRSESRFDKTQHLTDLTKDIDIADTLLRDETCGMIRVKNRIGYFCSHLIQDSEEKYPSNGVLIFIRLFNESFIQRLQNLTNSKIWFTVYGDSQVHLGNNQNLDSMELDDGQYDIEVLNQQSKAIGIFHIKYKAKDLPLLLDKPTIISICVLLSLPIIITFFVYFFFLSPMTKIFSSIGNMNKTGKLQNISIHSHITEIDIFTSNFNRFIQQVRQYQQKLENDSNTDGLTNLFNRRYFDQRYDSMWRAAARSEDSLAIIMMDIDYFKKYNDLYGHQKGDDALKLVASKLKAMSRRANETLARYGGEEFVLIIGSLTQEQLKERLKDIIESIEALKIEHRPSSISQYLTISCGACFIEKLTYENSNQKEAALKTADEALYDAKANGRNQFVIRPLQNIRKLK